MADGPIPNGSLHEQLFSQLNPQEKQLLKELAQNKSWQGLLGKIPEPVLPGWSDDKASEDFKANKWIYRSGHRDGVRDVIVILRGY